MDWLYKLQDPIWETLAGVFLIFIAVIVITRFIGLRSFAKFTTVDFAFTVAVGSVISSTLTSSTSIVHGVILIFALLSLTALTAHLQRKYEKFSKTAFNEPLLLMEGKEMLEENMKSARISKSQVIAKLREANVLRFNQIRAVVLETTGDISVLHVGEDQDYEIEDGILYGVRRKP